MRIFAWAAWFTLGACAFEPLAPEPGSLSLRVSQLSGVENRVDLRAAVVWTPKGELWLGADASLPAVGDTVTLELPLSMPDDSLHQQLRPLESVVLATGEEPTAAYRPRVVIYEDTDGDGAFGLAGPDKILAVDGGELLAVLDLEGALAAMDIEEIGLFYRNTGDRFTPFFTYYGTETPFQQSAFGALAPLNITVGDPWVAEVDFVCHRDIAVNFDAQFGELTRTILVDENETLDPIAVCGLLFAACYDVDFGDIPAPELVPRDTWPTRREVQCRQGEQLEALIVRERKPKCEGCACWSLVNDTAYVIKPREQPDWWPCGEGIHYCQSGELLFRFDPECPSN